MQLGLGVWWCWDPPRFGFGSDFGFENPLRIFGFQHRDSATRPGGFRIGSDFGFRGGQVRKTRYVSSAFVPETAALPLLHNRRVSGV